MILFISMIIFISVYEMPYLSEHELKYVDSMLSDFYDRVQMCSMYTFNWLALCVKSCVVDEIGIV